MTSYTDEQIEQAAVRMVASADAVRHLDIEGGFFGDLIASMVRSLIADRTRLQAAMEVELVDLEMTLQAVVAHDPRDEIILRLSDQKRRISQAIDNARAAIGDSHE